MRAVLEVTAVGRDRAGDVVRLCGSGWSASVEAVIAGIESSAAQYFVVVDGRRALLRVSAASVYRPKFLRTTADTVRVDLLDRLPAGCAG